MLLEESYFVLCVLTFQANHYLEGLDIPELNLGFVNFPSAVLSTSLYLVLLP